MDVVVEEEDMVVAGVDMLHLPLHSRMHVGMTEEEEGTMVIIVDVVVPDMEEDPDMEVVDMVVVVDVVVVHPVAMR